MKRTIYNPHEKNYNGIDIQDAYERGVKDGQKNNYHSMDELYDHRNLLFLNLMIYSGGWKSKKDASGEPIEEGWFLAGTYVGNDEITYHLPIELWGLCCGVYVDTPEWDGHTSSDVVERLKNRLIDFMGQTETVDNIFNNRIKDIITSEEFQNNFIEEYRKNETRGVMTEELFEKVLNEIDKFQMISEENILYFDKEYNITSEEFMDVFRFIEAYLKDALEQENGPFHSEYVYFRYKGNTYQWRLLIGQGSSCSIRKIDFKEGFFIMANLIHDLEPINYCVRFYKREEK